MILYGSYMIIIMIVTFITIIIGALIFECPAFSLTIDVFPDFERSPGNSNVRQEIRTFDRKFQLPPNFPNVPMFLTINVFPDFERSTGNPNVRPVFGNLEKK